MAEKTIPTTHELRAMQWAEGLEAESLLKCSVAGFTSDRSDSVIQHEDRLEKSAGDTFRTGLRMQDNVAPITSGTAVEGNELAISLKHMDITIDEFVHGYKWDNVMSRQRVTFEHRDEARAALSDLLANAWDHSFFNQIAGITGGATTFDGNNTINAPDSNNHLFANGAANEAAITASDILSLDDISRAKTFARAGQTSIPIRKARVPGFSEPLYVVFVHPWQNSLMRQESTRWDNICNSFAQGGMIKDNPLITGAAGIWDGCLIVENSRVPFGAAGSGINTRRAILCGAQSAKCSYGRIGGSPMRYRWVEKLFDYDRHMGVMGGFIAGIKKSVYEDENGGGNAIDIATVVISSATDAVDV